MNSKNILTQKRHMPYTISIPYLEFAIFNSIVLVILYVIFVATEVHPDTIFSHNNNIKITNYTDYLPLYRIQRQQGKYKTIFGLF